MAEAHPHPKVKGKAGSFLTKDTAGLPNWAWIVVVGAGLAAAYIIPKFFKKSDTPATNTTPSAGNCQPPIPPACGQNQQITASIDTNGCLVLGCGPLGNSRCPQPKPPNCPAGTHIKATIDANGCLVLTCSKPCPALGPPLKCPKGCHSGYSVPDADGCTHRECHKNGPGKHPCTSTAQGAGIGGSEADVPKGGGTPPKFDMVATWPDPNTVAARRGLTDTRLENLNGITPDDLEPGQIVRSG